MGNWKIKACEFLPDYKNDIIDYVSEMEFWDYLANKFIDTSLNNSEKCSLIILYAKWCYKNDDISIIPVEALTEVLSEERFRYQLRNWFSTSEIKNLINTYFEKEYIFDKSELRKLRNFYRFSDRKKRK